MITADRSPLLHAVASTLTIAALLTSGLVALQVVATPATAQAALPTGADGYLVSRSDSGLSTQPVITPDGQRVAFTSTATDLVAGDVNGVSDVFLSTAAADSADPFSGPTTLVSRPSTALPDARANGASSEPALSADGRFVVFTSTATNLVSPATTAGRSQVYLRDVATGTTQLLMGAAEPNGNSYDADISDDGRYVVFTSDATNLVAGDTNAASDVFILDRDPEGDGQYTTQTLRTVYYGLGAIPGYAREASISGNGDSVAFTTNVTNIEFGGGLAPGPVENVYRVSFVAEETTYVLVAENASHPAIDGSGEVIATLRPQGCGAEGDLVTVSYIVTQDFRQYSYSLAAGTILVDVRAGTSGAPSISSDGSRIAWPTTQPPYDFTQEAPALSRPVIRVQDLTAYDAWHHGAGGLECTATFSTDWFDLVDGTAAGLSAGGRTIALSGPSAQSAATSAITVIDTHSDNGLSVTSTQGVLTPTRLIQGIEPADIPASELRGYEATVANAPIHRVPIHRVPIHRVPIHRVPIHRVPIHRVPIHRVPIHRVPIHRVDIPGGWAELLVGTPYQDDAALNTPLGDILDWAVASAPDDSTATATERAAAQRILTLELGDLDTTDSGIDALSVASIMLGETPLASIPIVGAEPTALQRWQARVDAQGLDFTVTDQTVLAELDYAGFAVSRAGVEAVALDAIPLDETLYAPIALTSLFLRGTPLGNLRVETLSLAAQQVLFEDPSPGGTLADNQYRIHGTVADLIAGVPSGVTFGDLLLSLLDQDSYPWEQIDPASVNTVPSLSGPIPCAAGIPCVDSVYWTLTFDPGPGESTQFTAATAVLDLPSGSKFGALRSQATGPRLGRWIDWVPDASFQVDSQVLRLALGDTLGGTSVSLVASLLGTTDPDGGETTATLTSGSLSAVGSLSSSRALPDYDDPMNNRVNGNWAGVVPQPLRDDLIYYEWISPESRELNDEGQIVIGPAADDDYYRVTAPQPGQRLIVSTNATDGQVAIALYSPTSADSPLGVASAGAAPGTAVTEQTGGLQNAAAETGADAGTPLAGGVIVDQAAVGGGGTTQVEAASTDVASGDELLLRVSSGNGQASTSVYSLRVQYVDEPLEQACPAWGPAQTADPGVVGSSDPITDATNTVYLVDTERYGDTFGAAQAALVRDKLGTLTGTGTVGAAGHVQGAVLSVDASSAVHAARTALDENPCSMSARRALTAAINAYVAAQLAGRRDQISSIVIVGGDDIIPLAPVAQHTSQFNEDSHAAELRRETQPDGSACPASVPDGGLDPCATPLSAAAATDYILTDDAYGLATAYESLGAFFYVPTVGLGRLIETPEQIMATVDRFTAAEGVLLADSTLTDGYGAWSELPDNVGAALQWRGPVSGVTGTDTWNATQLHDALVPAAGPSPRVVSINAHADESRMLPGIPGADAGVFSDDDLLTADSVVGAPQLAGSLLFTIGCHAANNLPTAYYGDVTDWADVFSGAGGFVGNTGYGLANSASTALSERLLTLYAGWIGVTVNGSPVSSAGALLYAKQSYLGQLGLYTGYDEKALMEAVYYGLPMYTIAGSTHTAPLPKPAPNLQVAPADADGLISAGLSFSEAGLALQPADPAHPGSSYLVSGGEAPLFVEGQPVLPRLVRSLPGAPAGKVARGVLITGLSSATNTLTDVPIADATVGSDPASLPRAGVAFPSTFAQLSTQQTPNGTVDTLVVTPARVQSAVGGTGVLERFTSLGLDVMYGDAGLDDVTAPAIGSAEVNGSEIFVKVDGTGSDVSQVILLAQRQGQSTWQKFPLAPSAGGWVTSTGIQGPFRWFLQAVDAAGNVAIDTSRGQLDIAGATAPDLASPAGSVTVPLGGRLLQSAAVRDAAAGEQLTGSYRAFESYDKDGDPETDPVEVDAFAGTAIVETAADGTTHALIDRVISRPGEYTVALRVCRGTACSEVEFAVHVPFANTAPVAEATVSAVGGIANPTATLSAAATWSDADDPDTTDPASVSVAYAWERNGALLDGRTGATLDLTGLAVPGDLITAVATPNDGTTSGGAARASLRVVAAIAGPAITATAVRAGGAAYVEGTWSSTPVTVSFFCASGAPVTSCPVPQTISGDTTVEGTIVVGEVVDLLGNRATSTPITVKVDITAPTLTAAVTPNPVALNGTATVTPTASDALSGLAGAATCSTLDTATAGSRSVSCTAIDNAGNSATTSAAYVVAGAPTITATATRVGGGSYTAGSWSKVGVKVAFTCMSTAALVGGCPAAQTVTDDTASAGVTVSGTVTDVLGGSATASLLVKVDKTAPVLAPAVTPNPVSQGATAVATANASDAASGVASQSCATASTATAGTKTVACTATDAAGNTASASASYVVRPVLPTACLGGPDRAVQQPLNADGTSVLLRLSAVPVIFRACDSKGKPIGTSGFVQSVTQIAAVALPATAKVNESLYLLPSVKPTYIKLASTWVGAIGSASLAGGKKYTYRVSLSDGTSFTFTFGLK